MILFPALNALDSDTSYTGLQVVFGHEFVNLAGFASGEITFSFMNLIAYALPVFAASLLMLSNVNRFIPTIMYGVAAVLLFLVIDFTVVTITLLGSVNTVSVEWGYAFPLIIAATLSVIGFGIGIFTIYKHK